MTHGLGKRLRQGIPKLNPDMSVSVYGADEVLIETLPASMFTSGGIGDFFERVVGLHYEQAGYAVEYRTHLGFLDRGVDLVAQKAGEQRFVQCKFTLRAMSPAKVENLLFAASDFVSRNLMPGCNFFDLAVPFEAIAFPKDSKARLSFHRYNMIQSQARLQIVEVPVDVPKFHVF